MSDGISAMYDDAADEAFSVGIEKISKKKPLDIYLLLKDVHAELQRLQYDNRLTMTRGQFDSLQRAYKATEELLK